MRCAGVLNSDVFGVLNLSMLNNWGRIRPEPRPQTMHTSRALWIRHCSMLWKSSQFIPSHLATCSKCEYKDLQ